MTTFIQPDYTIGNSADCQTQMIGVLQGLDQALQALQPSPATNVVQFNNSILLAEPASSNTNTMSNGLIVMSDGYNSSTATATTFNLTDNSGDIQLNESLYSIDFQNNNTSSYCQMGTLTQNSGLNGIEAFNAGLSTFLKLSTDLLSGLPSLALQDQNASIGGYTATDIILDGSPNLRPTRITLKDGTYTGTLTTTTWSGNCAGSAGSSTYASSVNIANLTTAGSYPVLYNSITTDGYNSLSMDATHIFYNPSNNKLTIGGTTNGSITLVGTASNISVAGTGTALSCPNATAINFGSATITGGTFNGALSGLASSASNVLSVPDLTTATNCPVGFFVNSSGQQAPHINSNLNFQPSTNTLRATTFEGALTGTASSSTNVILTSDNTSGTYYIPFAKTSGTGGKPLFIDDTTGPLTYNPSTANLSASIFTGSANITNAVNNVSIVATTLTLDFSTLTFKNFYNSTAITTAITQSAISFSNAVAGGSYMVYITTGVGGSFTFNTGIANVKTTFATAFTIPASSVGVMSIYYINSVYIVGINILT